MSTSSLAECLEERRPYHHGNLREALLARAAEVIGAEGVEALSLRALARDLGISHAAPARHFQTRTDLLAALAEDGVEKLIAATEAALAPTRPDPVQRLRVLARAYLSWAVDHPAHYNAVRNPEVSRHASLGLRTKMSRFAEEQRVALRRAQLAGWRSEVSLDVLMFQLVATLVGSATILADPLYRDVLGNMCDADRISEIVDRAFPAMLSGENAFYGSADPPSVGKAAEPNVG